MIKLREEELRLISKKKRGILVRDTESYYFKEAYEDGLELIIEKMAKMLDIKCPHYELITIKSKKYYLSKSIAKNSEDFFTFKELNINEKNINSIKNTFSSIYPKHVEYLMKQIIKIYLFDILILNPDRRSTNIGIYFKNKSITDIYILDNECAFYKDKKVYLTAKNPDSSDKTNNLFISRIPAIRRNMEELELFLKNSDDSTRSLFNEMYEMINPEVVKKLFAEIEQDNNREFFMKEEYLRRYSLNYEAIGDILGFSR